MEIRRKPGCAWAGGVALAFLVFAASGSNAREPCLAQSPARQDARPIAENRGAAALDVALKQLHTRASMMMITAHPDDEDGATLAYESRMQGTRVGLLTLNRGEGGANEMSSDLWDPVGPGADRRIATGRPLLLRYSVLHHRRRLWILEDSAGSDRQVGPRTVCFTT